MRYVYKWLWIFFVFFMMLFCPASRLIAAPPPVSPQSDILRKIKDEIVVRMGEEDLPLQKGLQGVVGDPNKPDSAWALIEFVNMINASDARFRIIFPPEAKDAPLPLGARIRLQAFEGALPRTRPAPGSPVGSPKVTEAEPQKPSQEEAEPQKPSQEKIPIKPIAKPAKVYKKMRVKGELMQKPPIWSMGFSVDFPYLWGAFVPAIPTLKRPGSAAGMGAGLALWWGVADQPGSGDGQGRLWAQKGAPLGAAARSVVSLHWDFASYTSRWQGQGGLLLPLQSHVVSVSAQWGKQWDFYKLKWVPEPFFSLYISAGLSSFVLVTHRFLNGEQTALEEGMNIQSPSSGTRSVGLEGRLQAFWYMTPRIDVLLGTGLGVHKRFGAGPLAPGAFGHLSPHVGLRVGL